MGNLTAIYVRKSESRHGSRMGTNFERYRGEKGALRGDSSRVWK
jgi:hypothetical protein